MNDNEYSEEIAEYTVYKSKLEFDRLKKDMDNLRKELHDKKPREKFSIQPI